MKILDVLNKLLPKKKNRIVLISNLGFRDNTKSFYDYLVRNNYHKRYDLVCVSDNYYDLERISSVKYVGIKTGLYYYLTSKFCFYCFGKYPAKPTREQMVVNFGHGMPIKTNGNLKAGFEQVDYNYYTKVLATSAFFAPIIQRIFGADDHQILIANNPRNDDLFTPMIFDDCSKRVLWMPTFRNDGKQKEGGDSFLFSMDETLWRDLNQYLKLMDIMLYIKLHPLEKLAIVLDDSLSNISMIDDATLSRRKCSLYSFIGGMSGLITDYSSVYYDYLLLNRPVLFVCDDFEAYSENRGFVFNNQKDYMVGDFALDLPDIKKFLFDIRHNNDPYFEERAQLNNLFNEVQTDICQDICRKVGLSE